MRDTLLAEDIGFVLAHATRLRAIAEANYKKDEIDAELLARMRVAGCIPEVHAKGPAQRELALVVRHRAWLVRDRTAVVNRMHAQLHAVGLRMERGRLLTKKGQRWVGEAAWPLLRPEQRRLMRTHVRIIRQLQVTIRGLDRRIRQFGAARPRMCAPGDHPGDWVLSCADDRGGGAAHQPFPDVEPTGQLRGASTGVVP